MEFLKQNKMKILYIGGALLLLFITMGVTYAVFTYAGTGTKENTLSTGKISFEYNETSNGIELTDAVPMSDTTGKIRLDNYFDFNVKAEIVGTTTISYTVYGVDISEKDNKLEGKYVKVYLTDQSDSPKSGYTDTVPTFSNLAGVKVPNNVKGKMLYQNQFSVSGTHDYRIRMWVDESYEVTEVAKTFKMRVDVTTEAEEIPLAITTLLKDYANEESAEFDTENADNPVNHKMFVFHHEAGAQQQGWNEEELTDYRYIGADPNNYVTFNGEEAGWRIIGIFTVENEKGEKEKRIKLIRRTEIDTLSWDNKNNGEGTAEDTNGYGSNNWSDSRIMMLLNEGYQNNPLAIGGSLYWNQGSGLCPYGSKGATKNCNFTNNGFTKEAQEMIEDTKWYLGGTTDFDSASNGLASHFYGYERGTETCQTTENCTTEREISWIGKVGLMYPSDYGYATSGGSTTNREACLAKEMHNWDREEVSDCKNNDWLLNSSTGQWTMSPRSSHSDYVFVVRNAGYIRSGNTHNAYGGRPAVYLVSDIQYLKGSGSKEDPFVFEI